MLRSVIIYCGGIEAIPAFIAQTAIAFDSFTSAGSLVKPMLDPFAHPELISTHRDLPPSRQSADRIIASKLRDLDERVQILAETCTWPCSLG